MRSATGNQNSGKMRVPMCLASIQTVKVKHYARIEMINTLSARTVYISRCRIDRHCLQDRVRMIGRTAQERECQTDRRWNEGERENLRISACVLLLNVLNVMVVSAIKRGREKIGKWWWRSSEALANIYSRSELNRKSMFIFERVMTFSCRAVRGYVCVRVCVCIYETETETYTYGIAFQRLFLFSTSDARVLLFVVNDDMRGERYRWLERSSFLIVNWWTCVSVMMGAIN